jgi:hypothetical protein
LALCRGTIAAAEYPRANHPGMYQIGEVLARSMMVMVVQAAREEQTLLTEMSRLMDRMRATEGHLRRVRGQLRPLQPHDTLVG